jgi:hypothetical protein
VTHPTPPTPLRRVCRLWTERASASAAAADASAVWRACRALPGAAGIHVHSYAALSSDCSLARCNARSSLGALQPETGRPHCPRLSDYRDYMYWHTLWPGVSLARSLARSGHGSYHPFVLPRSAVLKYRGGLHLPSYTCLVVACVSQSVCGQGLRRWH